MKVTHLSSSLSRDVGGIFEIELALAKALESMGVACQAIGLTDDGWKSDSSRWGSVNAQTFPTAGPKFFGYSKALYGALCKGDPDIGHLHSLWMYPSIAIHRWSNMKGKPYVVTPNGMLEPWALRNSAWKKRIASAAYEKAMLKAASCLHVNTVKELHDCRKFGLNNPIAVIPNGVELPKSDLDRKSPASGLKTLLFLGRIHPKKGLVNAINAWAKANISKEWRFVIAGWDQNGHEAELIDLCRENDITCEKTTLSNYQRQTESEVSISFVGPAFGNPKEHLLQSADAFILPSFSEGMPISILEAWSYQIPTLMTSKCNLDEGFKHGAAIEIEPTESSVRSGIEELLNSDEQHRRSIGESGRLLIEQSYTWPMVARKMLDVYQWLIDDQPMPDFVFHR
ncbi:MAG: glycosyltransferase [Verrucomicrobiota bacterium]